MMATPEERKKAFERKRAELYKICDRCRKASGTPSIERCDYGCTTRRRLRMLETEYSDVSGWSHDKW